MTNVVLDVPAWDAVNITETTMVLGGQKLQAEMWVLSRHFVTAL